MLRVSDHRHGNNLIITKQLDTSHTGAVPAAEHAHGGCLKANGLAIACCHQHVIIIIAGLYADKLIPLTQLHGDLAIALDIGEITQLIPPDIARRGAEHHIQAAPAALITRHRHDGVDRFIRLDWQQIDHRLAKRLWRGLRQLVAFQLIDHAL